jgi:hypothetical protein
MAAESALRILLALTLVFAGCGLNPRVTAPELIVPDRRDTAARYLDEALGSSGRGVSEVHADEDVLRWNEQHWHTDKRMVLVQRELILRQVRAVSRPEKDDIGWTLYIDASGGEVVFRCRRDQDASKAEAAFKRLMLPN